MGLPAGTYSPASISFADAGNERASMHLWGKLITAANHDAQQSLFATLITKVNAVVLGAHVSDSYAHQNLVNWSKPTNGAARELALLVKYRDTTTGVTYTCKIPTVDPTIPVYLDNISARDAIDMTTPTAITDLITAFEAFAVNPLAPANAIAVIGLKVVRGNK